MTTKKSNTVDASQPPELDLQLYRYRANLDGVSPLFFSKMFTSTKLSEESPDEYDKRCWLERCHTDLDGFVAHHSMGVKGGLIAAAKQRGDSVVGKGQQKFSVRMKTNIVTPAVYTVLCQEEPGGEWVKTKPEDMDSQIIMCHANPGKKGGARVPRKFPVFWQRWRIPVEFHCFDPDVNRYPVRVENYLKYAGMCDGLGPFRPGTNGGSYGRYVVRDFECVREEV